MLKISSTIPQSAGLSSQFVLCLHCLFSSHRYVVCALLNRRWVKDGEVWDAAWITSGIDLARVF